MLLESEVGLSARFGFVLCDVLEKPLEFFMKLDAFTLIIFSGLFAFVESGQAKSVWYVTMVCEKYEDVDPAVFTLDNEGYNAF